jgi:hypothetical protein
VRARARQPGVSAQLVRAIRRWDDLPDDRDLANEAEAWYLHDLASQLPVRWPVSSTKNDLLAVGYNAGAGNVLRRPGYRFARLRNYAIQVRPHLACPDPAAHAWPYP